ncbi:DUF429 domain-containing protein [Salinicoccus sp. RF5]|uniref:DUF429 domain-containing protein n=1 Tax=Salinicoccus sp. RF5 TaxID=2748874 RepID=UPI001E2C8CAE|nr:DUF429 domain-containing protein [Salinicoccus sp. RF5]MCC4721832.1 DUF429 domain-containing protein [Salinicoccus sp. RF5]
MIFIGIDLAWTYRNETGVCVMDADGRVEFLDAAVYSNEDILDIIMDYTDGPVMIAIDAPLIVNNESGSRGAEGELMRSKIHGHRLFAFNSNRAFLTRAFGDIRGETLMNHIIQSVPGIRIGFDNRASNIVETFPTGICCGLFPDKHPIRYKKKRKMTFKETCGEMDRLTGLFKEMEAEGRVQDLIEKIDWDLRSATRKSHKHLEDKVDAFLCAYGMYNIYTGAAEEKMFGSIEEGFIILPIKNE